MLVCITGVIGAGKTSLVKGLSSCCSIDTTPFYEPLPDGNAPNSNFMLEAYYNDPQKYAYSMQTLLLALRFRAQQEAQWRSQRGELCVLDSSVYSDKAFLEVQRQCGYIDDYEYRAYNKLCEIHFAFMQYPDLLIHLDLPLDEEIRRIKERSRDCECGIETDYLIKLHSAYDDLISYLSKMFPVAVIDARPSKDRVLHEVIELIKKRRMEMEQRQSYWPSYKRNTGY
jgi:deoxyadenosine/deoxycytidine kinase